MELMNLKPIVTNIVSKFHNVEVYYYDFFLGETESIDVYLIHILFST